MDGPLDGIRIIELAGLGALPFGTLKLADMGADIVRVDRLGDVPDEPSEGSRTGWDRGRRSIGVDLKSDDGVEAVLRMVEGADVLLEAFRPGVAERLGVGPEHAMARNPRLVYGRLTGWGQTGPLSQSAGHSLNYEAITGVTRAIGPAGGPPSPTLTLLGDFAGGGLLMAYGVVCALLEAQRSGQGQVIDCAMVDGVMSLAGVFYSMADSGMHVDEMGANLFDGGAPFYNVYETADEKYVSVAPIEAHFYRLFLDKVGLGDEELPDQWDRARWPELRARIAEVMVTKTRDEWCDVLENTDACFAPVLTFSEARSYHHHTSRGSFGEADGEPIPFPRFSRTPGVPKPSPAYVGADTDDVLSDFGFSEEEIAQLRARSAVK